GGHADNAAADDGDIESWWLHGRGYLLEKLICNSSNATYICASLIPWFLFAQAQLPRGTGACFMAEDRKKVWVDGFQTRLFFRIAWWGPWCVSAGPWRRSRTARRSGPSSCGMATS